MLFRLLLTIVVVGVTILLVSEAKKEKLAAMSKDTKVRSHAWSGAAAGLQAPKKHRRAAVVGSEKKRRVRNKRLAWRRSSSETPASFPSGTSLPPRQRAGRGDVWSAATDKRNYHYGERESFRSATVPPPTVRVIEEEASRGYDANHHTAGASGRSRRHKEERTDIYRLAEQWATTRFPAGYYDKASFAVSDADEWATRRPYRRFNVARQGDRRNAATTTAPPEEEDEGEEDHESDHDDD